MKLNKHKQKSKYKINLGDGRTSWDGLEVVFTAPNQMVACANTTQPYCGPPLYRL